MHGELMHYFTDVIGLSRLYTRVETAWDFKSDYPCSSLASLLFACDPGHIISEYKLSEGSDFV